MATIQISDAFDHQCMRHALLLAKRGMGWVNPNPMVGCVIVKNNRVIGEGWHQAVGLSHAEIMALQSCSESPADATLYVTLTPCNHTGRTPPCTRAIIQAGIGRVMIGSHDPMKHARHSIMMLENHGISVTCGILEKECEALNPAFYHQAKSQSLYVHAKWAMSLDGSMIVPKGDDPTLSCQKSLEHSHIWRQYCDAILVGVNTVIADNPKLSVRLIPYEIKPKNPMPIILDPHGKTPLNSFILNSDIKSLLIGSHTISDDFENALLTKGHRIKKYALDKDGLFDLKSILDDLYQDGTGSILLEGGPRTRDIFLKQDCVHGISVCLTPFTVNHPCDQNKKRWNLSCLKQFDQDVYSNYF